MANRDLGAEILAGIEEINAHQKEPGRLRTTELSEPSSAPGIIRSKLQMSATTSGIRKRTLSN